MTVLIVAIGALVASCVQSTAGLGFALILTPVLFAVMPSAPAVVITTLLGLMLNVLVLFAERRRPAVAWRDVTPIVAAAAPGCVCGVLLLESLPKAVLQVLIGVAVVGAAVARAEPRHVAVTRASPIWTRLSLGFVTGTMSTSTGVTGPPLALWLAGRGVAPRDLRDCLSALFLAIGTLSALSLLPLLQHPRVHPVTLAMAAATVVLGHAVGRRLFSRLTSVRFHRVMLAIVLATGVASLVLGLGGL